jgi:hypothetical protein
MRIYKAALVTVAFGFLCALCTLARQEQENATLSGTVTDASGAAVPGVDITLKKIDCVCSKCKHDCDCCPDQQTTSNEAGYFSISTGHGKYSVRLKKAGFRNVEVEVDLSTSDRKNVEVAMVPGEVVTR